MSLHNDRAFKITREQLVRIESALLSLRRRMLPEGRRQYEVFSEGYVDQINDLRQQIEEYLGIHRDWPPPIKCELDEELSREASERR
jgi:hypothetical protein